MKKTLLLASLLAFTIYFPVTVTNTIYAEEVRFEKGINFIETSPKENAEDVKNFLGIENAPNISKLEIEVYNGGSTGIYVDKLNRGDQYMFWVWYEPTICSPYYVEEGFFRNGKMVYYTDREYTIPGQCHIAATGIMLTVPENAPLGSYTWGARTTTDSGQDTFYPDTFEIIN